MNAIKKLYRTTLMMTLLSLGACGHPEQKFAITVTDEKGEPMEAIECKAWFKKPGDSSPIKDYFVTGHTNASGKLDLTGETIWAPTSVEARKNRYYLATAGAHWTIKRNGDRWEPWPVEVDLVMKKIRNPQPMYAVRCGSTMFFEFPKKELGPYGFDLEMMDWVAPNGRGKVSDFILQGIRDDPADRGYKPKGNLKLSFSNPEDGIFSVADDLIGGSVLRSPAMAREEGYRNEWLFPNTIDPTKGGENQSLPDMVYIFRVRTKVDAEGRLTEARYGKIYGNVFALLSDTFPSFRITYYLNGTPNDRGLEWDMKTNLFRNLPPAQWPQNP
jgi:hypothetical protein